MRWFLGLVLVIALVCGALYGVGLFLLPNSLAVTRTLTVNRPRASVFAMSNDLRIAKEWSPLYAQDPDADYAFGGDGPGEGQSMRWASNNREIGSGRMSIVNSVENQSIDAILDITNRATLNSHMDFRPGAGSTAVSWSLSAQCGAGAVNVPCRYMNLVMRPVIERRMDAGLRRLKTLAEQLPNIDFEHLNPQFDSYEPQTFVYSTVDTPTNDQAQVDSAEALALQQVRQFMSQYNLTPSAPLMRVVTNYDAGHARMSFRVGYPFASTAPTTVVGVQIGQTPSGEAMHVMVRGTREQVRNTYEQMYAYLQAHRIAPREGGKPWEVVHDAGSADGSAPTQIEIFVPLG
ncbi:MAG: SRPBCC family protein [Vitreimonas sp.]